MRKSKNYYKFMEYMAFGISGWHDDAVMVDNGVIECVAYPKVAHIEDYSKLYKCNYDKMTMDSDNTWLAIKCVLVNEEVINVYYVTNECNLYIGQLILDDYRTQKQALDAIHKKVVCFFLNSREFCELHPTEEEINEYEEILETGEEATEDYNEYEEILDSTETEAGEETTNTTGEGKNNELKGHLYIDTDSVKIAPLNPTPEICRFCPADRQGNRCCGEKWCAETWKRYEAIINPEWHHVSLATLSNIDINMLDEKRQRYFKIYQELIKTIQDLHKCKTAATYEIRWWRFKQAITDDILYRETTLYMTRYLDLKISMCNVECGLWASSDEKATGFKKSRRYGHATLK